MAGKLNSCSISIDSVEGPFKVSRKSNVRHGRVFINVMGCCLEELARTELDSGNRNDNWNSRMTPDDEFTLAN